MGTSEKSLLNYSEKERREKILSILNSDEYYSSKELTFDKLTIFIDDVINSLLIRDIENPIITKFNEKVYFEPSKARIEENGLQAAQVGYSSHFITRDIYGTNPVKRTFDSSKHKAIELLIEMLESNDVLRLFQKEDKLRNRKDAIIYAKEIVVHKILCIVLITEISIEGCVRAVTFMPKNKCGWIEKQKASGFWSDALVKLPPYTENSPSDTDNIKATGGGLRPNTHNKDNENSLNPNPAERKYIQTLRPLGGEPLIDVEIYRSGVTYYNGKKYTNDEFILYYLSLINLRKFYMNKDGSGFTKPVEWLFIATYPNAYIYTDTRKEKNGDYYEIGRIVFNPFEIKISDKSDKYSVVHDIMQSDYDKLEREEVVQVSATGQTTRINKDDKKHSGGSLESQTPAQIIAEQMGGKRTFFMIGAKDIYSDNKGNTLVFKFMRNPSGANYCRITLTSMDTYKMEFMRVRGVESKVLRTFDNVYAEDLKKTFSNFTGLVLSLKEGGKAGTPEVLNLKDKKPTLGTANLVREYIRSHHKEMSDELFNFYEVVFGLITIQLHKPAGTRMTMQEILAAAYNFEQNLLDQGAASFEIIRMKDGGALDTVENYTILDHDEPVGSADYQIEELSAPEVIDFVNAQIQHDREPIEPVDSLGEAIAFIVLEFNCSVKPIMKRGGMLCPVGTEVQSLLFDKTHFNRKEKAIAWAKEHGYVNRLSSVDETAGMWHIRQQSPHNFKKSSIRTIEFTPGVKARIGCPIPKLRDKKKK